VVGLYSLHQAPFGVGCGARYCRTRFSVRSARWELWRSVAVSFVDRSVSVTDTYPEKFGRSGSKSARWPINRARALFILRSFSTLCSVSAPLGGEASLGGEAFGDPALGGVTLGGGRSSRVAVCARWLALLVRP
jgi:hypothetical protein